MKGNQTWNECIFTVCSAMVIEQVIAWGLLEKVPWRMMFGGKGGWGRRGEEGRIGRREGKRWRRAVRERSSRWHADRVSRVGSSRYLSLTAKALGHEHDKYQFLKRGSFSSIHKLPMPFFTIPSIPCAFTPYPYPSRNAVRK